MSGWPWQKVSAISSGYVLPIRLTLGVLGLVHFSDILPLLEVDDGEDTGDGLADGVADEVTRLEQCQR